MKLLIFNIFQNWTSFESLFIKKCVDCVKKIILNTSKINFLDSSLQVYMQMPQAWVWANYISTLVLLLPDHRDLNSCVDPEPQLKV